MNQHYAPSRGLRRTDWHARLRGVLVVLAVGLGMFWLEQWRHPPPPQPAQAVWPVAAPLARHLVDVVGGDIPMPSGVPAAHAASLLAMPPGQDIAVQAFWFAGSRESAPDVRIAMSSYSRSSRQWSPPVFVVDRETAGAQLGWGLRRLGNPVAWRDRQGRTHLFVVTTGLGGWAASRILQLRRDSDAADFQVLGVLPLSWLWNTSHLVRALPLPLRDSGMVLPAYFELGVKYPVALRFGPDGDFLGVVRISARRDLLQPTLLARTDSEWVALMRDNRPQRKLRAAITRDGGAHWDDLPDPGPANPDASIVGLALRPDRMVLAYNPDGASRSNLILGQGADGISWPDSTVLAPGGAGDEYSYPSLAWADDSLWVTYTDQRRAIAWRRFVFKQEAR